MIERIEHLSPELDLHALGYRKHLDESEVDVPITGSDEDVAACAILSRRRDAERLSQIHTARQRRHRFEQHRTSQRRSGQFLKLRADLTLHACATLMTAVGRKRSTTNSEWLAAHVRVDRVDGPPAQNVIDEAGSVAEVFPSFAQGHFPHRRCREGVRAIEIGSRPFFAEVTNIGGRA